MGQILYIRQRVNAEVPVHHEPHDVLRTRLLESQLWNAETSGR